MACRPACKNQGGSFDYLNASFAAQNLYLRSLAIYGASNDRRYIAVWHANPGYVKWHVHAARSGADYQATFDAETQLPGFGLHGYRPAYRSAVCRPDLLLSFQGRCRWPVGGAPWHDVGAVPDRVQSANAAGNYPICVQGGGTTANRFMPRFLRRRTFRPRANGPPQARRSRASPHLIRFPEVHADQRGARGTVHDPEARSGASWTGLHLGRARLQD